nr:MAG: hypothetical protein [Caudoviricetes sp.]
MSMRIYANQTTPHITSAKGMRMYEDHVYHKPPNDKSKIVILESNLTEIGALALERRMIRWYGRKDIGTGILINKTDGGDGVSGYKHSEDIKERISSKLRNRIVSKQTRTKQSKSLSGLKRSIETCDNISKAKMGISSWNKGIKMGPQSEDHKKKAAAGKIGKIYRKQEIIQCPHCNTSGATANMNRYHFDNCKLRNKV